MLAVDSSKIISSKKPKNSSHKSMKWTRVSIGENRNKQSGMGVNTYKFVKEQPTKDGIEDDKEHF
jgi:hypothetical protein